MNYQDINAKTIDRWVEEGWEWGIPIRHEAYLDALSGKWDVLLTPTKAVPHSWFGEMKGKRILGLASGGGQQMPVFAALGADCTVLDYSESQLESEREVAQREGYDIQIIRADMTKPLPFEDESFDMIFHPVSNCYVERVEPIFAECFRVLKRGGVLLSGLGNEVNYLVNDDETTICNTMPCNPLVNEAQRRQLEEDDCGVQFSHTIEEQLGGQLKAGFVLTDIYGDTNGEGRLHEMGIETYYATRAVKPWEKEWSCNGYHKKVDLRPMGLEDAEIAVRLLQDDLVKRTYMVPNLDREGANKLFLRLKELSEDDAHYVRGIYLKNTLIGWINDTQVQACSVELGWVIDPVFHNQGYGTAAVKAALAQLHGKGIPVVIAGAFAENIASIRVMEKAGMKRLEQQEQIEYRGKQHLCVYYESRMK